VTFLDETVIAAIDARVQQGEKNILAFGTVNAVNSVVDCTVTFDGSSASIPCKNFGDVLLIEGDRVGVAKIGAFWTVFGNMSARWQSENGISIQQSSGTTISSTLVDMPSTAQFTFVKYYDSTRIKCWFSGSGWVTASPTAITFGMKLVGANSGTTLFDVGTIYVNNASTHIGYSDMALKSSFPADVYTVTAQWRRNSGTGTVTADTADRFAHSCKEIM
jgi:hypothetical protein